MVMSVYSRTSAYTALRPVGSAPRSRVVQPTVHRNSTDDHAPERGHDVERRRYERDVSDTSDSEVRVSVSADAS